MDMKRYAATTRDGEASPRAPKRRILLDVDEARRRLFSRVPQNAWLAFLAALGTGLIAYFFFMTNLLPNHDGVLSLFTSGSTLRSGRWFLPVTGGLLSRFMLPWLNGLVALLSLGVAAALTTCLLRVERPFFAALIGVCIPAFPSVANIFCYMFTIDAYGIGFALGTLGVYLVDRSRYGVWFGGVLLALACGTYQPLLVCALALCAVRILLLLLEGEKNDRDMLRYIGRYALAFVLGAALYAAVLLGLLALKQTGLSSYQGGAQMVGGFTMLPRRILLAYEKFFAFLFSETRELTTILACFAHAFLLFGTTALTVRLLVLRKRSVLQTVLAIVVFALLPLVFNGMRMLQADIHHILMDWSIGCFYVLVIALAAHSIGAVPEAEQRRLKAVLPRIVSALMALALAFCCACWCIYANKLSLQLDMKYENSYALVNRMVDRIEQSPAYTCGMRVAFVGSLKDNDAYQASKGRDYDTLGFAVGGSGRNDFAIIKDEEHLHPFSRYFIGVAFEQLTQDEFAALCNDARVKALPSYPAEGSVACIDGVMVVKLSDA